MSSTNVADLRVMLSADLSSLPGDVRSAANILKSYVSDAVQAEDATRRFGQSFFGESADLLSQKSQAIIGGFNVWCPGFRCCRRRRSGWRCRYFARTA